MTTKSDPLKSKRTEELFAAIAQFIAESRVLLESDALIELAGLDVQVQTLCEAVLELSQDERVAYADRLQELLAGLHDLGEEMVARREGLAEEMRGVSKHKKANSAYRTVDASVEKKKEDEG